MALVPQFRIQIGHDDRQHGAKHEHCARRPQAHLATGEGVGVHEHRRQVGGVTGAAGRHRRDQVEALDGDVGKDHQRAEEHRAQARQHDAQIDARQAGAVDLRGAHDRLVDPAQPGEKQRHDETGGLPYRGDHQAVDDPIRVHQPVEAKAFPAPVAQQLVQAQARVEQPFPGRPGDDHRQGHGVQVDGADEAFAADTLVEQHSQQHADRQADGDEQPAEYQQVLAGHPPAVVFPQPQVLLEPDPLVARHEARVGERQDEGPEDVAIEADQHDQHARCEHQLGQPVLQRIERRGLGEDSG